MKSSTYLTVGGKAFDESVFRSYFSVKLEMIEQLLQILVSGQLIIAITAITLLPFQIKKRIERLGFFPIVPFSEHSSHQFSIIAPSDENL